MQSPLGRQLLDRSEPESQSRLARLLARTHLCMAQTSRHSLYPERSHLLLADRMRKADTWLLAHSVLQLRSRRDP